MSRPSDGSNPHASPLADERVLRGRYLLQRRIASGGMASVHLGRLLGPAGFSRVVAIKRLHAQFAEDPVVVNMLLDEARIAGRVRHPNVVPVIDVVSEQGELLLVLEYVHGEPISRLLRRASEVGQRVPLSIVGAIITQTLDGLQAAHEAIDERGNPLGIVHRDVSPQNILVGADGVTRITDFGIAKARGRLQTTREGQFKGKMAYMAPEQFSGEHPTAAVDIYAAGVVLWEILAGKRLFEANDDVLFSHLLQGELSPPSAHARGVSRALDAIVLKALAKAPRDRFASALDMSCAIARHTGLASNHEVAAWVRGLAHESLARRAAWIEELEREDLSAAARGGPLPPQAARRSAPPPEEVTRSDELATLLYQPRSSHAPPAPRPQAPPAPAPRPPAPPPPAPRAPVPPAPPVPSVQLAPLTPVAPVAAPPRAVRSTASLVETRVYTRHGSFFHALPLRHLKAWVAGALLMILGIAIGAWLTSPAPPAPVPAPVFSAAIPGATATSVPTPTAPPEPATAAPSASSRKAPSKGR